MAREEKIVKRFCEYLKTRKPVMGMLHLAGANGRDMLARALREAETYFQCGVDAVLVENYFGSARDCESVLRELRNRMPGTVYGVNILGDYPQAFRLAEDFGAQFIQIDSVCGHLPPASDAAFANDLRQFRAHSDAAVLGGVRFKYQPVRSGRTLEEDLKLGMERCDAIVVTGEGTGLATPMGKILEFRQIVGDFPLIVGAGVTIDTVQESLAACDGAIVGSWFKEGHRDTGEVNAQYVKAFMLQARNGVVDLPEG